MFSVQPEIIMVARFLILPQIIRNYKVLVNVKVNPERMCLRMG